MRKKVRRENDPGTSDMNFDELSNDLGLPDFNPEGIYINMTVLVCISSKSPLDELGISTIRNIYQTLPSFTSPLV